MAAATGKQPQKIGEYKKLHFRQAPDYMFTKTVHDTISPQPPQLLPFAGSPRADSPDGLPLELNDHLELVGWSGRIVHPNKRGFIAKELPLILKNCNRSI